MVENESVGDSTEREEIDSLKQWPMAAIRDLNRGKEHNRDWSGVFPPINHENLPVGPRPGKEQDYPLSFSLSPSSSLSLPSSPSNSSISSSSSFLPSDVDDAVPTAPEPAKERVAVQVRETGEVSWWWRIGLGVVRSKMAAVMSPFSRKNASWGGAFWPIIPAAVATLWMVYIRFQLWRRQRRRMERANGLMLLIKEKDKKIAELLSQVAQMNELRLSRQRT